MLRSDNSLLTYSMLSPLNQDASGDENPCFLFSVISLSRYFERVLRNAYFPFLWAWILLKRSFSSTFLPWPVILSDNGTFIAKSTKSLSKNGTRVSKPCAILSLSSTTSNPCKKVFASRYKLAFKQSSELNLSFFIDLKTSAKIFRVQTCFTSSQIGAKSSF